MRFEFDPSGKGRFTALLCTPLGRKRIGEILGRPGRWYLERKEAPQAGPFKTREQAAKKAAEAEAHGVKA